MNLRVTALLVALPAMVAGLLVAAPAEASHYNSYVSTRFVSINSDGYGRVYLKCNASTTCTGKISFLDDAGTPYARTYSMGARRAGYVSVRMHTGAAINPNFAGAARVDRGDYYAVDNVRLLVNEDSPQNVNHVYTVTTETPVARQEITGQVTGPIGGLATNVQVELWRILRGGSTQVVSTRSVASNGGSYSFSVALGTNNSASGVYQLRVTGTSGGDFRSWFWRGADASPAGGGRYLREASPVQAKKAGNFDADFNYSSISGNINNTISAGSGVNITVAAPPKTYSSSSATRREYDLPGCANVYGQDRTNSSGGYQVDFLPYYGSSDKRYMVGAKYGVTQVWNQSFGSCFDTMDYSTSTANLIALNSLGARKDFAMRKSGSDLLVNAGFSGFTPTSSDRWIRLREKVPGLNVLSAPVVAEGFGSSSGYRAFRDVPPGKYWVEVGRRTGCSAWYPSRFPDNNAYLEGADRGAESWKSFTKLSALSDAKEYTARHADPNPAGSAQTRVPSGYRGWMYRSHCKAYGAGTYDNTASITGFNQTVSKSPSTVRRGAVVKGHVSRAGGRTNKEMMVRVSSTDGKRVLRTDITDGSGNFYIAGLPSGNWTISVNSDSWRGIGRTFTGKHSVRVTAGNTYRVGTLYFKS